MRIVVTSDTHTVVDTSLIPDGDVFIHAGDLMTTGYVDDWKIQLEWLAALPHKKKLYIPGNHDYHIHLYPGPALQDMRKAGVTVIGLPGNMNFASHKLPDGSRVLGLPYVKNLPRWAFNATEAEVEAYIARLQYEDIYSDIVVSHSPVHGHLDGGMFNYDSGFRCYAKYIECHKPKYWFHGHIHECYGESKLNDTQIFNVSMCDRKHRHANKPVVVDIC